MDMVVSGTGPRCRTVTRQSVRAGHSVHLYADTATDSVDDAGTRRELVAEAATAIAHNALVATGGTTGANSLTPDGR